MRMDEMNKLFEEQGFIVKREYQSCDTDCNKGYYTFTISKGTNYRCGTYRWPDDQHKFVDKMIEGFEKDFPMYKKITIGDVLSSRSIKYFEELARRMDCNFKVTHTEDEHGLHLYFYISYNSNDRVFSNNIQIPYPCVFNIETICNEVKRVIYSLFDRMREASSKDDYREYCKNDVEMTKEIYRFMNGKYIQTLSSKIKNVIFNDPATIVIWTDGTKTVVKCQDDDVFDPEKGLAMAISKKALGNKGNYCNELKKWLPKEEEAEVQEFNFIGNVESITKLNDGISFECTLDGSIAEKFKAGLDSLKRKMNIHSPSETIIGMNTKSNDPVRKAYDILIDCRDNGVAFDIDTVIGHLGEALED